MTHYEYKVVKMMSPTASTERLNILGTQRWTLQAVVNWEGRWYYYLMREIEVKAN